MRWLLVIVLIVGPCTPCEAGTYSGLASSIIAAHHNDGTVNPRPQPGPAPVSDVCDNCNGTGKLGDGTVFVKCPVCNGTGKKVSSGATIGYPTSTGDPMRHATRWTGCSGWQHLTQGEHAGKFDATWLRGLTLAQVHALHDDDHEGRVKWEYVVRGSGSQSTSKSALYQYYYKPKSSSNCPGGVCPPNRGIGRLFGR